VVTDLSEWIGIASGALATIGASYILIRAGRRDRREDRVSTVEKDIGETQQDVAHIEGHLEAKTGYRPRSK
jgi:hypothetical protein